MISPSWIRSELVEVDTIHSDMSHTDTNWFSRYQFAIWLRWVRHELSAMVMVSMTAMGLYEKKNQFQVHQRCTVTDLMTIGPVFPLEQSHFLE